MGDLQAQFSILTPGGSRHIYIYIQTNTDRNIDFYSFLQILKDHLKIEECICVRNNQKDMFNKKWSDIVDLM